MIRWIKLDQKTKDFFKEKLIGPALQEIRELIEESRPPRLFLIGRSGHGKSSLLNALANKNVAEVDPVRPCTLLGSDPYTITFENTFSTWEVFDSRGVFEPIRPGGGEPEDVVSFLKEDLKKRKPDVIMHVIKASECRNLSNDLKMFREIKNDLQAELGIIPPTIILLSNVDILGVPEDWPPEQNAAKAGLIMDHMDFMADEVLKVGKKNLDENYPIRGYVVSDDVYIGIIPTVALHQGQEIYRTWNIDTLSDFIGEHLPKSALLNFVQAQRRKELLRKVSRSITKKFAGIAGGIGAFPIPGPDIAVITPFQFLLIGIIGGLSCRPINTDTVKEYLGAAGVNVIAAFLLREMARQLLKIPIWTARYQERLLLQQLTQSEKLPKPTSLRTRFENPKISRMTPQRQL